MAKGVLTAKDFGRPLRELLPPRMPRGHPVNQIRGRIARLLERVAELRDDARALTKRKA